MRSTRRRSCRGGSPIAFTSSTTTAALRPGGTRAGSAPTCSSAPLDLWNLPGAGPRGAAGLDHRDRHRVRRQRELSGLALRRARPWAGADDRPARARGPPAASAHPLPARDLTEREILARVAREIEGARAVLVLLDSDHSYANVLAELRVYHGFVTPGSYCVVEDGNVGGPPGGARIRGGAARGRAHLPGGERRVRDRPRAGEVLLDVQPQRISAPRPLTICRAEPDGGLTVRPGRTIKES